MRLRKPPRKSQSTLMRMLAPTPMPTWRATSAECVPDNVTPVMSRPASARSVPVRFARGMVSLKSGETAAGRRVAGAAERRGWGGGRGFLLRGGERQDGGGEKKNRLLKKKR